MYLRFDFNTQQDELRSVGLDGSEDRSLFTCQAPCDIVGLAISPGATNIAFVVRGPGEPDGLYITDIHGGNPSKVDDAFSIGSQAWSPDGKRIAFVRALPAGQAPVSQTSLWVADRTGAAPLQATAWNFLASPPLWFDNDHLLFSQASTGTPPTGWTTLRVDSGGEMRTEAPLANGEIIEASPDRTHLVSMVETMPNDPSHRELTLVPLNGGEPQPIEEIVNANAAWAPDGKSFAFYDAATLSIVQAEVADGSRTELKRLEEMHNYPFVQLGWVPDGSSLVFTRMVGGKTDLLRLDLETRAEHPLTSYQGDPQPFVVVP